MLFPCGFPQRWNGHESSPEEPSQSSSCSWGQRLARGSREGFHLQAWPPALSNYSLSVIPLTAATGSTEARFYLCLHIPANLLFLQAPPSPPGFSGSDM